MGTSENATYDVSGGALRVDGHDVRDVRLADLRSSIGCGSQDTFLLYGTVAERGPHEELLAADGVYTKLWGVQAGEIEELPETFLDRAASGAVGSDP